MLTIGEILYALTVVAFFAHWIHREINLPKGPGSAAARWHSRALALLVGGCAVLVYEQADDKYGVLSFVGIAMVALGFVIDGALHLHRRRSNPSSDSDREPEN